MRHISKFKESKSFMSGWDTNDDPMENLDKAGKVSKTNSEVILPKLPCALDYINTNELSNCWKDVQRHVLDLKQKGNRFKKVLTDPILSNANFSGYYFVMYQNEMNKCYDIGNICVIFSIKNVNNLIINETTYKPNSIHTLRTHPAYPDIIDSHERMMEMLNLINEFKVNIFVGGSVAMTTNNEIYIQISYSGINNYIKFVDDQLSDPKIRTKYFSPHRLYEPIDRFVDDGNKLSKSRFDLAPISKLKFLIDENPSVRYKNRTISKDEVIRNFNITIRLLIENGFKFKHIIKDASKVDTLQAFKSGVGKAPLFYLIAMTGKYKDIDLIQMDPRFFLYNQDFQYFSLGSDILYPLFKYCLDNTDILFELPEGQLAILYLIYDRKLLRTHLRRGGEISQWIDSIMLNKKLLAQGLIINNKKDEARWVIDLLKGAPSKQGASAREALSQFRDDISSSLTLIKSRFESSNLVGRGKFNEMPDFNYFRSLVVDLNGYL